MDVLERLDRREVPTLIVTGGKDFSAGKSVFREMHFAAPRASFVHLPEACHAGMIGEREAVTEALEAFLHEKRESVAFNRRRLYDATGMNVSPPESPVKTAGVGTSSRIPCRPRSRRSRSEDGRRPERTITSAGLP